MSEPRMDLGDFSTRLEHYFDRALEEHGPTPRGVDWNSPEAQDLRFEQILKLFVGNGPFTVNDYGCGYGALIPYLRERGYEFAYTGYDLSQRMRDHGRELFGDAGNIRFVDREEDLAPADYTIASGVLHMKMDVDFDAWTEHALETIQTLGRLTTRAFAFNALTKYSDPDRMRPDLYYADPGFFFDYCKRNLARDVALLHDYGAYEFTMIVRLPQDE
jgi:SAM-dependent methyltransferase